jgi:hypothetical protein
LVSFFRTALKSGYPDLEANLPLIIAVMAWTGGEIPGAWDQILRCLWGSRELHLRTLLRELEHPLGSPFWRQFLSLPAVVSAEAKPAAEDNIMGHFVRHHSHPVGARQ